MVPEIAIGDEFVHKKTRSYQRPGDHDAEYADRKGCCFEANLQRSGALGIDEVDHVEETLARDSHWPSRLIAKVITFSVSHRGTSVRKIELPCPYCTTLALWGTGLYWENAAWSKLWMSKS